MKHRNQITAFLILIALAAGIVHIAWAEPAPWYSQWTTAGLGITANPVKDAERDSCVEVNIQKNGAVFWQKEKFTLEKNRLYKISVDFKPAQGLIDAAVPVYLETEYFEGYGPGGSVEFERKPVMGMVNSADLLPGWNTLTAYYRYNGVQDSANTRISVGINGGFIPAGQTRVSYRLDNFQIQPWDEALMNVRNTADAWIFNDTYDTCPQDMDGFVRFSADRVCQKAYQPIVLKRDTAYTAILRVRTDRDTTGGLYLDHRGFGDTDRTDILANIEFQANEWTEVYAVFRYQGPAEQCGGNIYLRFDADIAQYDVADFQVFSGSPTVLNPDFSRGLQFWNVGGGTGAIVQDDILGQCAEIMPAGQSFFQLSQTVRLEKNKWYVLYAKVKINANDTPVQPTVKFHMLNYITTEGLGATYVTPGEWSEVYTCFQYTGEEKDATFILRAGQNASGVTEYDSVKNGMRVAYAGILEADNSKMIVNGDFEDPYLSLGTSAYTSVNQYHKEGFVNVDPFWNIRLNNLNGSTITNLEANCLGNQSQFLRMTPKTSRFVSLTQRTEAQPGKQYLVTADARAYDPAAGNISAQVFVFDQAGSYIESAQTTADGKEWRKMAYLFQAADTVLRPEIRYGQFSGLDSLGQGICIDNFQMVPVDGCYAQVECVNAEGAVQDGYTDQIRTRLTFANGEKSGKTIRYIIAQYQGNQLRGAEQKEVCVPAGEVLVQDFTVDCLEQAEYARVFILDAYGNPVWIRTDIEKKGERS